MSVSHWHYKYFANNDHLELECWEWESFFWNTTTRIKIHHCHCSCISLSETSCLFCPFCRQWWDCTYQWKGRGRYQSPAAYSILDFYSRVTRLVNWLILYEILVIVLSKFRFFDFLADKTCLTYNYQMVVQYKKSSNMINTCDWIKEDFYQIFTSIFKYGHTERLFSNYIYKRLLVPTSSS